MRMHDLRAAAKTLEVKDRKIEAWNELTLNGMA